ncbi:MAG: hypothetical protein KAU20_07845 [Nanoarchaeota archaeon]|nr:hypothetical protein [Nanoarchaeota archaeon]
MTSAILDNYTYNLTSIISGDIITEPTRWIANVNLQLGSLMIVTFLVIFGVVLFLAARRKDNISDSEAASFAGIVISFIGMLLFVIDIVGLPDVKLLEWTHLLPIMVITGLALLANYVNKRF